jgi:uncharacterized protein YccT (UPF0319 family)
MTIFALSNSMGHEANIPAIQQEKEEQARVQGKDVYCQRAQYHFRQAEEGT